MAASACLRRPHEEADMLAAMRIGASVRSGYRVDDARMGARWMIERARAASDAGLDCLLVGDQHITAPVAYYQNTAILGRLLSEWDSRPAGALFLLPLWNPVLVAEQAGTLAAIGGGPFILQVALGGGREKFAGMGAAFQGRSRRLETGVDVVRRLLSGEVVDSVEPIPIRGASVAPLPPAGFEVWVGAAAAPAIERAARIGDCWYADPGLTLGAAAEALARYREYCHQYGRTPGRLPIRRDLHVAADDADAERVMGPLLTAGYRGIDTSALAVGTVSRVVDLLGAYADLGFTDVIARQIASDQTDALASYERLAEVRSQLISM
jgi:alkanesulfonate monooxygenase SsuD/methylene tetrahydromethanopterin reductase-like flavin-dependent oxidoreductase (luciferase family)